MSDEFRIEVTESAADTRLAVSGELDILTSVELQRALDAAVGRGRDVAVDLARVTFIDSTALRVLLTGHHALDDDGRCLVLDAPSAVALRVLTIAGLVDVFHVQPGSDPAGAAPSLTP